MTEAETTGGLRLEDLLGILVRHMSERAIFAIGVHGNLVSWNPGVLELFGYEEQEWLRQSTEIIFTPEDRQDRVPEQEMADALANGSAADVRWHVRRDGTRVYADGLLTALRDERGRHVGFVKLVKDATTQKVHEQRLEELTLALEQGQIFVRSGKGEIRFWSKGCERLYGYIRQEAVGRNCFELLHTEFPARLSEVERILFETGLWHGQLRHRRKDGTLLVTATDWIVHQDRHGEGTTLIDASTDVSHLMRLTEEREKLMQQVQRSNKELAEFSSGVSHDLQAPLRMIKTFTLLLAQRYGGKLDETADEFIQAITSGATGMEALIDALLQYARVGENETNLETIRMNSVVEAVLMILQPVIQEQNATVAHAELPTVQGFRVPLQQLFQNLIGNALKYRSPSREPRIRIGYEMNPGSYIFWVADNGMGIPHQDKDVIFQPLKRLHGPDIPGTGIGLALCRKIVERHHGRIWVESQVGRGSTFYFSLPR